MIKSILAFVFLVNILFLQISQAQHVGDSCPDLSVTGISKKDELLKVFDGIKSAALSKDSIAIEKYILFPLVVNSKPKRKPLKNKEELQKDFAKVFTSKVLKVIELQKFESLFCRDQGVMIGDGEVWINESQGKIGIAVINL